MTTAEMDALFLTLYDKWASNGAPPYDKLQKSWFMTKSQNELIKRRLYPDGRHGDSFEETEKRAAEFQALISNTEPSVSTDQTGVFPNGEFYDLPTDFWLSISEYADIKFVDDNPCYTDNIKTFVKVVPKRHDEVMANIDNPYEMPFEGEVWRLKFAATGVLDKRRHELITDGSYTIDKYTVRYLRQPKPIILEDLDGTDSINGISVQTACELDDMFHEEIVTNAVLKAVATNDESQQYQIQTRESQLSE